MNRIDRAQFDEQLALLCAGYGVWVGERPEAYWKGLAKMSLIQFARCVEFALSEEGPEKVPNIPELWKIHKGLRAKGAIQDGLSAAPEPEYPKWLLRANLLFLAYLMRRRMGGFQGDINLTVRRTKCLELAAWFEGMEAEYDPEATPAQMGQRFIALMERVPDIVPRET